MRQPVRRVPSIVLLAAAFWSLALGPELDTPQRYDGDGDDEGLIGPVLFRGVDINVTDANPTFVPVDTSAVPAGDYGGQAAVDRSRPPRLPRSPRLAPRALVQLR